MNNSEPTESRRLTKEEAFTLFDFIANSGENPNVKKAMEALRTKHFSKHHRTTVSAFLNVVAELFKRKQADLKAMTREQADEIADQARYGVSRKRVFEIYGLYSQWISEQQKTKTTVSELENGLIIHDFSRSLTGAKFEVIGNNDELIILDMLTIEVLRSESINITARPIIELLLTVYKYEVYLEPGFKGELVAPMPEKHGFNKGDAETFSLSFTSPPGNRYVIKINLYYSIPETGREFVLSTDSFELVFPYIKKD